MSSPKLNLNDFEQSQLIYIYTWTFVKRLYDPLPSMIDSKMKRRKGMTRMQNSLVFDIKLTIPNSPSIERRIDNHYCSVIIYKYVTARILFRAAYIFLSRTRGSSWKADLAIQILQKFIRSDLTDSLDYLRERSSL